jgi:hypothetical protein
MRTGLVGLAIAASFMFGIANAAEADASKDHPGLPSRDGCKYEDSVDCVWDARHMGNGEGRSFRVGPKGHVTYIPHGRAHRLVFGCPDWPDCSGS